MTQVAQLILAVGLLLFLFFLTGLIALLPKVALGAILIVTAIGMLEVASLKGLYKIDRVEFGIAAGVTLAILIAGVVPGIILGLLLSLISVLVEISRPDDAVLRRRRSDGKFHDCRDDDEAESVPGLLVYRLYAPLIFANARHVMTRIRTLVDEADPPVRWLVIDAQAIHDMDVTAAQRFAELHRELAEDGRGCEDRRRAAAIPRRTGQGRTVRGNRRRRISLFRSRRRSRPTSIIPRRGVRSPTRRRQRCLRRRRTR